MNPREIAELLNVNIYCVNDALGIKTPEMLRLRTFLREAKTPEEVGVIHTQAPYGSRVWRLAWKKLDRLCLKMVQEAETCERIMSVYEQIPKGMEAKKLAMEKWHSLSLDKARKAKTKRQLFRVYAQSPRGSVAENIVFRKTDRLFLKDVRKAKTREEIVLAYRRAFTDDAGSEAKKLVIKKLAALKS